MKNLSKLLELIGGSAVYRDLLAELENTGNSDKHN